MNEDDEKVEHVEDTGINTKTCAREDCDELIIKKSTESKQTWAKRKYCGQGCRAKVQAEQAQARVAEELQPKPCANPECEQLIKPNSDHGSNMKRNFEKRRYCSMPCQMSNKRAKTQGRRANEHRTNQRPVTTTRKLSSVSPVRDIPPPPPAQPRAVWRPAGFTPEPVIPGRIRRQNEHNQRPEQRAS